MKNIAIGVQLKEERERLGYTQADFAELVGASKRSQIGWEKGERFPDASALAGWAEKGVDILYVVTGERAKEMSELPADEQLMLDSYRELGAAQRKALLAQLLTGNIGTVQEEALSHSGSKRVTVKGEGNRVAAHGNYFEHGRKEKK
ncbi:helix-turn-helix domain-containing protein [Microbulbifer sp. OS29]|uniref:Helix-turn-helix domain-containing protein n=1 Tax=Microbulbifer okhotskensis TaxID=2926617 RepID=A0A9X2J7M7_9GAMM|nr:helix-turn-helix transcriptional regulator [Microbulbifer okhotskensis]MCO1336764.1 helix-turn-helix domain-containing protein [Microbulbifer okhotskensis]